MLLCRLHHAAPPGGLAPLYPLLAPRLRTLDLELERVLPPGRSQADLSCAPPIAGRPPWRSFLL
jgi:hypothetical protein